MQCTAVGAALHSHHQTKLRQQTEAQNIPNVILLSDRPASTVGASAGTAAIAATAAAVALATRRGL